MTDEIGMLQFSRLSTPDPTSGYTLDDNARALIISLSMENGYNHALKYASYLNNAQQKDGTWSNFLFDNKYYPHFDSEDSFGRALLACSLAVVSPYNNISKLGKQMLLKNVLPVKNFRSPRGIAYALLALCKAKPEDFKNNNFETLISTLSERLISFYQLNHQKNWLWFEETITYCNGVLPQSLYNVYTITGDKKSLKIAHESLNFLCQILFRDGYLNIIGNRGWHTRNNTIPLFDQQPVDAASIIYSCLDAYEIIGEIEYLELAVKAYKWYHGLNIHGISLYDNQTGGCYDGLTPKGLNLNQGAEAVLSLLFSDTLMKKFIEKEIDINKSS
jgi:hypothetical protein